MALPTQFSGDRTVNRLLINSAKDTHGKHNSWQPRKGKYDSRRDQRNGAGSAFIHQGPYYKSSFMQNPWEELEKKLEIKNKKVTAHDPNAISHVSPACIASQLILRVSEKSISAVNPDEIDIE